MLELETMSPAHVVVTAIRSLHSYLHLDQWAVLKRWFPANVFIWCPHLPRNGLELKSTWQASSPESGFNMMLMASLALMKTSEEYSYGHTLRGLIKSSQARTQLKEKMHVSK